MPLQWVIGYTGVKASVEQALRERPGLLASVVDETLQPRPGIFELLAALQAAACRLDWLPTALASTCGACWR